MRNNVSAYLITCQTNLHVGNGASDQGIIDNLVQRDPVDGMPAIYASSLKGAFREYMRYHSPNGDLETVFGSENPAGRLDEKKNQKTSSIKQLTAGKSGEAGSEKLKKGEIIFHDAILLSIPVRSNKRPYFHATCPMLLRRILEFCDFLVLDSEEKERWAFFRNLKLICEKLVGMDECPYVNEKKDFMIIESFHSFHTMPSINNAMRACIGGLEEEWVIFPDKQFAMLVDNYNLPVIARNYLKNGESKNLFYEQIIPRQSRFVFFISSYSNEIDKISEANKMFDEAVTKGCVQIGANGSIGYGYCQLKNITKETEVKK